MWVRVLMILLFIHVKYFGDIEFCGGNSDDGDDLLPASTNREECGEAKRFGDIKTAFFLLAILIIILYIMLTISAEFQWECVDGTYNESACRTCVDMFVIKNSPQSFDEEWECAVMIVTVVMIIVGHVPTSYRKT